MVDALSRKLQQCSAVGLRCIENSEFAIRVHMECVQISATDAISAMCLTDGTKSANIVDMLYFSHC